MTKMLNVSIAHQRSEAYGVGLIEAQKILTHRRLPGIFTRIDAPPKVSNPFASETAVGERVVENGGYQPPTGANPT